MADKATVRQLRLKYRALRGVFDERSRRQWAAAEAMSLGCGGINALVEATGIARNTICAGIHELTERLANPKAEISSRIRAAGGGRKALTKVDPELAGALDQPASGSFPVTPE